MYFVLFIYILFFNIKRFQKLLKNKYICQLLNRCEGYIEAYFNIFLLKFYKKNINKYQLNNKKRKMIISVSLTTFPDRINYVWIAIESLFRQTIKPDNITLWISKDQFCDIDEIPDSLLCMKKKGLNIELCEDDLRSHKKYYYVLEKQKKDELVILIDDDMFYPPDTISKLLKLHKKYPNDICCITSEMIGNDIYSLPSTWKNPDIYSSEVQHSTKIQIFSGSGTLIPYKSFSKDVFNKKNIKNLCPYADDLWLTLMSYKNNKKISSLRLWRPFPIAIYSTEKNSLWHINAQENKNDEQWRNLVSNYPDVFKKIKEARDDD